MLHYDGGTGEVVEALSAGLLLQSPAGLTFGPDGSLYVSSNANNRVLRFDSETGALVDVFVHAGSGGLLAPTYLVFHDFGCQAVHRPVRATATGLETALGPVLPVRIPALLSPSTPGALTTAALVPPWTAAGQQERSVSVRSVLPAVTQPAPAEALDRLFAGDRTEGWEHAGGRRRSIGLMLGQGSLDGCSVGSS